MNVAVDGLIFTQRPSSHRQNKSAKLIMRAAILSLSISTDGITMIDEQLNRPLTVLRRGWEEWKFTNSADLFWFWHLQMRSANSAASRYSLTPVPARQSKNNRS